MDRFELTDEETITIQNILNRHQFSNCNLDWIVGITETLNKEMRNKARQIFSNLQTTLADCKTIDSQRRKDEAFIQELQDENVKLREKFAQVELQLQRKYKAARWSNVFHEMFDGLTEKQQDILMIDLEYHCPDTMNGLREIFGEHDKKKANV